MGVGAWLVPEELWKASKKAILCPLRDLQLAKPHVDRALSPEVGGVPGAFAAADGDLASLGKTRDQAVILNHVGLS